MIPESEQHMLVELQNMKMPTFSGEECFGQYLDLHECYNMYINSKFGHPIEYIDYLHNFPMIDMIPSKYKATPQYKEYMKEGVLAYLTSFVDRAMPLLFLDRVFKRVESECSNETETALVEAKVNNLCELLRDVLEQTRERVRCRQGMTFNELALDRDDDHDILEEEDKTDDYDDRVKLPLGWDGKPIPYWLYKLHGLNQEFKCEICGNFTYKGRRAYEKHFHGAWHQHGMDCLGIPNTKAFHEITRIDDARELWQHIQLTKGMSSWQPEVLEEYEDAEGNVYNKKTYDDLVRRSLIQV